MQTGPLTPEQIIELIAALAGIFISLAATYLPKFNTWYASLTGPYKALFMLGLNILGAVVIGLLSCAKLTEWVPCTQGGLMIILQVLLQMLIGNQLTYLLTKSAKPASVLAVEAEK